MDHSATSAIGALVDPDAIEKGRVTDERVSRVVSRLEPADAQRYERDLMAFDRDGKPSDFLLGIVAVAAGQIRKGARSVTVFDIRSNVVGVLFGEV